MLPAATATTAAVKPAQPVSTQTAQRAAEPQAPETARSSAGESAASNVKAETAKAVAAPEQTAVAPRLRDQETAEQTNRAPIKGDAPAGPPPAFEESPLERQARVAFDPPDVSTEEQTASLPDTEAPTENEASAPVTQFDDAGPEQADPPPTPTERAEASFAETRTLSEGREPSSVNVAR